MKSVSVNREPSRTMSVCGLLLFITLFSCSSEINHMRFQIIIVIAVLENAGFLLNEQEFEPSFSGNES
jgi:hypothetical protein